MNSLLSTPASMFLAYLLTISEILQGLKSWLLATGLISYYVLIYVESRYLEVLDCMYQFAFMNAATDIFCKKSVIPLLLSLIARLLSISSTGGPRQGDFYLQNFGLSKSLSNHLKIYIHGSQNWFQNDSRSKSEILPAVLRFA